MADGRNTPKQFDTGAILLANQRSSVDPTGVALPALPTPNIEETDPNMTTTQDTHKTSRSSVNDEKLIEATPTDPLTDTDGTVFEATAYRRSLNEADRVRFDDEAQAIAAIQSWWMAKAGDDSAACLAKLREYGSADFDVMAQSMIAIGGDNWSAASDEDKARIGREMAILFYLQGKIARAFGALQKGRVPSEDTINDTIRYGMMWARVRETGRWGE